MILRFKITILTLICLFAWDTVMGAKVRRQRKETREYHENGKLRKYTRVRTAQTIGFEADNNFKSTKLIQREYYANGKPRSFIRRVTKISTAGKPCYEVLSVEQSYDEQGTLRKKEIHKCDSGKTIIRYYNEHGKLYFTRVIYEIR